MNRKNSGFAADLAAGIDLSSEAPPARRSGIATNMLTGRGNRLADLASGSVVTRTHELVDRRDAACGLGTTANMACSVSSVART